MQILRPSDPSKQSEAGQFNAHSILFEQKSPGALAKKLHEEIKYVSPSSIQSSPKY